MLTAERLRYLFRYNPETGQFWRRHPHAGYNINREAGHVRKGMQYREIRVDQKLYLAHRLAWLYMTGEWPTDEIDHIDMDHGNNRWANLRAANRQQNQANTRARSPLGLKGVSKKRGRYRARISVGKQEIWLGMFDTPEEAHAAYRAAAEKIHGEFARAA